MNPIPPFRWFVTPSGGTGQPWWKTPTFAHPMGAAVVVFVFSVFWPVGAGVAAALLAEATNQWHKATRDAYGPWLWREVCWRLLLALGGAVLTVWVLP